MLSTRFYVHYPFHSQDLISNYPSCMLHNSYKVSSNNLVLDYKSLIDILFYSHLLSA